MSHNRASAFHKLVLDTRHGNPILSGKPQTPTISHSMTTLPLTKQFSKPRIESSLVPKTIKSSIKLTDTLSPISQKFKKFKPLTKFNSPSNSPAVKIQGYQYDAKNFSQMTSGVRKSQRILNSNSFANNNKNESEDVVENTLQNYYVLNDNAVKLKQQFENKYLKLLTHIKRFVNIKAEFLIDLELFKSSTDFDNPQINGYEVMLDGLINQVTGEDKELSFKEYEKILYTMTTINRSIVRNFIDAKNSIKQQNSQITAFGVEKLWILSVLIMEKLIYAEREKCLRKMKKCKPQIDSKFSNFEKFLQETLSKTEDMKKRFQENIDKLKNKYLYAVKEKTEIENAIKTYYDVLDDMRLKKRESLKKSNENQGELWKTAEKSEIGIMAEDFDIDYRLTKVFFII